MGIEGKVFMQYLNFGPSPLGGRGGVVRFFMLANGIECEEELFALGEEWKAKKAEFMKTKHNPAGTLPVVTVNGVKVTQHISIIRYMAETAGISPVDSYQRFVQDAIADQYQILRDDWANSLGDEDAKKAFTAKLPGYLDALEGLYEIYRQTDSYLSLSTKNTPLWGDSAVFGIVSDLMLTAMLTPEQLEAYPHLKKVYDAYRAIPAVDAWFASKTKA